MQLQLHIVWFGLFAGSAQAAPCTGKVSGHIETVDGLPVAEARVTLDDRVTTAADDGRFVFPDVCEGDLQLEVMHPAYMPWRQMVHAPNDHVDVTLEVDTEVIVVEETSSDARDPHSATELTGVALERTRGEDLAEALARVPGVTVLRTSGDASKPMVRGLYGRRLLLLRDGMRHESQKWGDDHAPELDPFEASAITVVRGAAGVRYGPDAIGGVILLDPPDLRREPGVGGSVDMVAVSNGGRGVAAGQLDVAQGPWSARIQANVSQGGDLRAPDYVLANTASQTTNLGLTLGFTQDDWSLELGWRHHDFRAGLCHCLRSDTPDALQTALSRPVPLGAEGWKADMTIERAYQHVTHDVVYARLAAFVGFGTLEARYNTQINQRREYDQVRSGIEGPQFDFDLYTHTADLSLQHQRVHLGDLATVEGTVGIGGSFQDNVFAGLPLVPNHRARSFGAYVTERLYLGHTLFEAGARVDHQNRTTFLTNDAYDRHLRRGTLEEGQCELDDDAARCDNAWSAASVSVGAIWHDARERLELRMDLSSASRFPNGDELYLNGSAPTQPVYGLGRPDLRTETTWSASPSVGVDLEPVRMLVSAYANRIDRYILFAPSLGDDGQVAIDVTAQGAFPRYAFDQVDAVMVGAEGEIDVSLGRWLTAHLAGSIIRGSRVGGGFLPRIPADRVILGLEATTPSFGPLQKATIGADLRAVARQHRSDATIDLVEPPPGYALVDAHVDLPFELDDERELTVGLVVSNLLDTPTRSYTSLLRPFADDPGREVRARARLTF